MSTIFITIPAYEDDLLISTIDGALSNAKNPENLHFAIALMYDVLPDLSRYVNNFKFITYEKATRPGLNMIRHDLFNLYDGEDYLLMVDSHTLFAKNWDSDLIKELSDLRSIYGNKTIISKQVPAYAGPLESPMNEKTIWEIQNNDADSFLFKIWAEVKPYDQDPGYYLVNHASGHFFFAPGNFVTEVGIIPVQGHYAQEEMLSYTSFMHGWSIYARSDYLHIGHNSEPYNKKLYKVSAFAKDEKPWGVKQDSDSTMKELEKMFLYNTGKYKIDTDKSPIDFYKSVNIDKEFLNYLSTVESENNV
ncbi:MAG: hypothetical protein RLZZ196_187 [Bacteroidota bacterium]|jgi:hypothetical protein